ncbi:MAG: hypothetical protein DRO11_04825, partial [Methanobacteriota archaeon]
PTPNPKLQVDVPTKTWGWQRGNQQEKRDQQRFEHHPTLPRWHSPTPSKLQRFQTGETIEKNNPKPWPPTRGGGVCSTLGLGVL